MGSGGGGGPAWVFFYYLLVLVPIERAFPLERPGIVVARLRLLARNPLRPLHRPCREPALHGAYPSSLPPVGEPVALPARAGSGDVSDRHGVSTGSESLSRNPTKDVMSRFFIHLHDSRRHGDDGTARRNLAGARRRPQPSKEERSAVALNPYAFGESSTVRVLRMLSVKETTLIHFVIGPVVEPCEVPVCAACLSLRKEERKRRRRASQRPDERVPGGGVRGPRPSRVPFVRSPATGAVGSAGAPCGRTARGPPPAAVRSVQRGCISRNGDDL